MNAKLFHLSEAIMKNVTYFRITSILNMQKKRNIKMMTENRKRAGECAPKALAGRHGSSILLSHSREQKGRQTSHSGTFAATFLQHIVTEQTLRKHLITKVVFHFHSAWA